MEYVIIDSPQDKTVPQIASEVIREIDSIRAGRGAFYSRLRKGLAIPRPIQRLAELNKSLYLRSFNDSYGNFPLTNFGSFGIESGIAVAVSPVVAALCIGKMTRGSSNEIKLSLGFDHRCADGAEGGAFLMRIKSILEDDTNMLLF